MWGSLESNQVVARVTIGKSLSGGGWQRQCDYSTTLWLSRCVGFLLEAWLPRGALDGVLCDDIHLRPIYPRKGGARYESSPRAPDELLIRMPKTRTILKPAMSEILFFYHE